MTNNEKIVSSHIFIFPFRWDYISNKNYFNLSLDKRINIEKFIQLIDRNKWEEEILKIDNNSKYNQYAYFYDNVRQSIYGKRKSKHVNKESNLNLFNSRYYIGKSTKKKNKSKVVCCFKYKQLNDNSQYKITIKKDKDKQSKIYSLKIKDIKLKVYDTGVANLTYFLENYDQTLIEEDILKINDYGRRIYPQFLPLENCKKNFLSEKLLLELPSKTIEQNFNYDAKEKPDRISNTIMELLGENFKWNKQELNKGNIYIRPVIDDRMFTICTYRSNSISRILTKYKKYNYLRSDFWYKYVFVDNGDPTCQDNDMFKELLKKSTYTRWKKYGTLYGISRYSFVCIVNEKDFGLEVIIPQMKTLYYEMVLLALTQRASILRFSDETSKIATLDEKEDLSSIKILQKYYIEFINDIYFREVTAQEQGIEMYSKLIEMMNIERDVKRLDEEIDEIHKYTALISNGVTNKLLHIITYFSIAITVCNFIIGLYTKKVAQTMNFTWIQLGKFTIWPLTGIILSVIIINKIIEKKKENILKNLFIVILFIISIWLVFL